MFSWLLLPLLTLASATAQSSLVIDKAALHETLLLQISYEVEDARHDFMTSRSHVVTLERDGQTLLVVDDRHGARRVVAAMPILAESADALVVNFNAGFDTVSTEEDRTGEDYYVRLDMPGDAVVQLAKPRIVSVARDGELLAVNQTGVDENRDTVIVHYYLSPYQPSSSFEPLVSDGLEHFGLYETYPQDRSGRDVFYGMKFGVDAPIVFALSSAIPARYRQAVHDGVDYWNKALGVPLVQVIDAPAGVMAPDPRYNVIDWAEAVPETNSHIQADPLTGEILHAHIFISASDVEEGSLDDQRDHLRYIVAHEVGHALGLRHNFARGPLSTVMNYFAFEQTVEIGRAIAADAVPLEYDRQVARHVYLDQPLDLRTLPDFCTDGQVGCWPMRD